MDHIILNVWLDGQTGGFADNFAKMEPVENIRVELREDPVSEAFDAIDQLNMSLVITDSLACIKNFGKEKHRQLATVYVGSEQGLPEEIPCNLRDVWPAQENEVYRRLRFRSLVKSVICEYESWLYRSWLYGAIDTMQDLIWFKDKAGLHWLVNNKFEDTVHKTREQVHGMGHNYIWDVPPEDGGKAEFRCLESEREVMEKKTVCVADEMVKTSAGMRHFLTYKAPLYGLDGDVMGTVGIGHDVTDLNNMSLEISMLLENLSFAAMACDMDWKPLQMNSSFAETFTVNESFDDFDYHAWREETFTERTERVYDHERHNYRQELSMEKDGKTLIFRVIEQEILDYFGTVTGFYCFFQNITVEKEYEQVILTYANTDPLTGLSNRRHFFEYLSESNQGAMTIFYMDMDNFKRVNDTLGHSAGDDMLISAAQKIKETFPDGHIARLGGDEFAAVVIGKFDDEEAQRRADILEKWTEEKYAYMNLGISMSVGISKTSDGFVDADTFFNESDERMYAHKQAKKKGGR